MSQRKNRTKINFGWPNVCSPLGTTLDEPITPSIGQIKSECHGNFSEIDGEDGENNRETPSPEGQKNNAVRASHPNRIERETLGLLYHHAK
jgi:hypothetical protein